MNCGHHHERKLPLRIFEDLWAYTRTRILITAIELDLFSRMARGHRTVESLSKACRASRRGLRALLDALTAGQFLRKSGSRYLLSEEAAHFLVREKTDFLGDYVVRTKYPWDDWKHLTSIVRRGKPRRAMNRVRLGNRYFPRLAEALFPGNFLVAREVAQRLAPRGRDQDWEMLDVACGAGPWSIAFAVRNPSVRVAALDLPEVLKVTKRFASRHGVRRQYEFLAGDWHKIEFGRKRYDLVVLGHILHSEGARQSQSLIKQCYRSLKEGGQILIVEINPDSGRRKDLFPLIFAVNMLMYTEEGNAFTFEEIRSWCRKAGFQGVRRIPCSSVSPLILARK